MKIGVLGAAVDVRWLGVLDLALLGASLVPGILSLFLTAGRGEP